MIHTYFWYCSSCDTIWSETCGEMGFYICCWCNNCNNLGRKIATCDDFCLVVAHESLFFDGRNQLKH